MVSYDMDTNEYNAIVFHLCDFFKRKELTVKQAQSVLHCCEEKLLYSVVNV